MTKIKKLTQVLSLVIFTASVGACSMTKKTDTTGDELTPIADASGAATDAVPLDGLQSAEVLAPPLDGAVPPTDPNAVVAAPTEAVAPPVDAPAAPTSGTYTMQTGDTLMKIAFETYGDLYRWREIYEANKDKIQDPNHVPDGTVLTLAAPTDAIRIDRNGERYLIKSGDTLGTISKDVYGTRAKWRKIFENNRQLIKDANKIYAGFYLYYVPEGAPATTSERGPATSVFAAPAAAVPAPELPAADVVAPDLVAPAPPAGQ